MSLIQPDQLKVEFWPPRPHPGGQHVGTGPNGVKITHIPTGIEACVEVGLVVPHTTSATTIGAALALWRTT